MRVVVLRVLGPMCLFMTMVVPRVLGPTCLLYEGSSTEGNWDQHVYCLRIVVLGVLGPSCLLYEGSSTEGTGTNVFTCESSSVFVILYLYYIHAHLIQNILFKF